MTAPQDLRSTSTALLLAAFLAFPRATQADCDRHFHNDSSDTWEIQVMSPNERYVDGWLVETVTMPPDSVYEFRYYRSARSRRGSRSPFGGGSKDRDRGSDRIVPVLVTPS